jgi:hypothetical protein
LENKNKDFDVDLKKSDILIYNFINQMKDIYIEPNRIRIGGSFYVFIKLYEKEIGREIQKDELEKPLKRQKVALKTLNVRWKTSES